MNFAMYAGFSALVKEQGIERAAARAAALGFSSVEILDFAGKAGYTPVFDGVDAAKRAGDVLRRHGLSVACYSVAGTLVTLDGAVRVREDAVAEMKRYAELAAALGSPFLHHTLIVKLALPAGAPTFGEVLMPVVGAAAEIAAHCAALGLTCLYEDQGMYFNGVENFGTFLAEMKKRCTNIGVCADLGNTLFADESPVPFLRAFCSDVKHVHLKDYHVGVSEPAPLHSRGGVGLADAVVGQGDVDVATCLQILREQGYGGAFALEDHYCEPYESSVQAAIQLVKAHF